MPHKRWEQRALGATLALLVQTGFLLLVLFSPHPSRPVSAARETILFFPPLAAPPPSTIDARGARRRHATPAATTAVPPAIAEPPAAAAPLAPPSGLAGFGRSLFGCAPEQYASLTPEQREHCPKPGEGLAKNDDRDMIAPPRSRAKLEAMWQEQWAEDHWVPTPCLPDPNGVANCLLEQSIAENRRAQAAWDKIAEDRASALAVKPPPAPASIRSRPRN